MSTVYKKLTAQDIAVVPFNAHKQYNFDSGSASSNSVNVFQSRWTSESIDLYSSASTSYGLPVDTINAIKYRQLDHLFYKNFKRDINNRFGNNHYLNQKRELYEEANILSIPTGLYGFEIKPGSFLLSSSIHKIVDDNNGNLIISGTNLNDYETDIRSNVLNIGPVKGFEKYDLNTLDNYITYNGYEKSVFYRDGKKRVNKISFYNTPKLGDEFDDSYYSNIIRYRNVNFKEKALFNRTFPGIDFDGFKSEVRLGHDEKYNFNPGDDFTINFWVNMHKFSNELGIGTMDIGDDFSVGYEGHDTTHLISKSTTKTIIPFETTPAGTPVNTTRSGSFQTKDIFANPQFPFEVFVKNNTTNSPQLFFERSDGNITTTVSASFTTGSMQQVTCRVLSSEMKIYINGIASGTTATDRSVDQTQNQANVYIGNKGGISNFLYGSLSQINIHNKALTDTQISNHYSSSNGSPYIGNIFYQNGFIAITHPGYQDILGNTNISEVNESPVFGSLTGSSPGDVLFNNDGTRMYTIGSINSIKSISQFNLSTAYDVSTSTFHVSKSFSQGTSAVAGHFNNDGSAIFVVDTAGERVRKFNVSTPFDISGGIGYASQVNSNANFGSKVSSPWGIDFNPDGSKMYIAEQGAGDKIYEFDLTTPFDVSTTSLNTELDLNDSFGISTSFAGKGIIVDKEGTRLLVSDSGLEKIYEFFLNTPYRIESAVFIRSYSTGAGGITGLFTVGNRIFASDNSAAVVEEFNFSQNPLEVVQFQGSHLIFENEYQCTIDEYEYNSTTNISARKYKTSKTEDLADFATGSLFKPYITTVGLYNEDNELLVVGKLGQPIKTSNETDTTLILRWDT